MILVSTGTKGRSSSNQREREWTIQKWRSKKCPSILLQSFKTVPPNFKRRTVSLVQQSGSNKSQASNPQLKFWHLFRISLPNHQILCRETKKVHWKIVPKQLNWTQSMSKHCWEGQKSWKNWINWTRLWKITNNWINSIPITLKSNRHWLRCPGE